MFRYLLCFLVLIILSGYPGIGQVPDSLSNIYTSKVYEYKNGPGIIAWIDFKVRFKREEIDTEESPINLFSDGYDYVGVYGDKFIYEYKDQLGVKNLATGRLNKRAGEVIEWPDIDWYKFNELTFDSLLIYKLRNHNYKIKSYEFDDCFIDSLDLSADTLSVEIDDSYINRFRCDSKIKEISIEGSANTLDFTGCVFLSIPDIDLTSFPKYIDLENCKFKFEEPVWELKDISDSNSSVKCILNLHGADLSKLKFKYSDFIIDTSGLTVEQVQSIYINLKEQYRKLGMAESLELVDIDLTRLNNQSRGAFYKAMDWINYKWWKYGYDKGRIVVNSLCLFLFFLLINVLFGLTRLLVYAYSLPFYNQILDKIKSKKNKVVRTWYRFWYIFLYTSLVFWGLNLDKKELKYQNLGYLTYIIFQYLVGLVCLAYLAAFILSK